MTAMTVPQHLADTISEIRPDCDMDVSTVQSEHCKSPAAWTERYVCDCSGAKDETHTALTCNVHHQALRRDPTGFVCTGCMVTLRVVSSERINRRPA